MEVIVWFHWVPLFVLVTLIVMRVLWNLDDRPGAAGSAALSATRAGNTVNRLRSAARAVRENTSASASTALHRCSAACRANSSFLAPRCNGKLRCPESAR